MRDIGLEDPDAESNYQLILDLVLRLFKFEFERFQRLAERHKKLKKRAGRNPDLTPQLHEDTKKINKLMAQQNMMFNMCLEIMRRMFYLLETNEPLDEESSIPPGLIEKYFKGFSQYLVQTLDRNDHALTLTSLQILDQIFQDGVPEVILNQHLALRMERFFQNQVFFYPYPILARLFQSNALERAELKLILPAIVTTTDNKFVRQNVFNLLSLLSFDQTIKETLLELEYDLAIFGMLLHYIQVKADKGKVKFKKTPLFMALLNIMLNLSAEPQEADKLMESPLFKKIIKIGMTTLEVGLLKIINNATYFCRPELTKKMKGVIPTVRDTVNQIMSAQGNQDFQVLFELLGIMSNCVLAEDWTDLIDKDFFKNLNGLLDFPNPNIKLQAILVVSQLSQNKRFAEYFNKKGIYLRMLQNLDDLNREEEFQVLFAIYQALLNNVDISSFLNYVVDILTSFLQSEYREREIRVVSFCNEISTILEMRYSGHQAMRGLLSMRFQIYNELWERKVGLEKYQEALEKGEELLFYQGGPMPGEEAYYYDDEYAQGDPSDDEYGEMYLDGMDDVYAYDEL